MEQSTQTSSRGEFTPFYHAGSSKYSDFGSENTTSPRHKYPLLPSKTHLGFQQAKVKGQTTSRRSALFRRPQIIENKHSPQKRTENDLRMRKGLPVRKMGFSEFQNGQSGLVMDGSRVSHTAQNSGMEPRAIGNGMDFPALTVRSKTITLGVQRQADRSYRQTSSSASNRRQCDACYVESVRQWLKNRNSATANRSRLNVSEGQENGKPESSPRNDDVTMSYMYYIPIQLVAQDEDDKSTPRDMPAITTVSVPKKGRLKLTGLSCELNNPDIYDNKREETNLKLQQKLYNEELMGPALPSTTSDLYRGTLLRSKSIMKQVKQGEQMLHQEEEATRHRKDWQEPDDSQLKDLIGQLLYYDMPEVPTINKNFQTFAGISPTNPSTSGQRLVEHQDKNSQHNKPTTKSVDDDEIDALNEENSLDTSHENFFHHKPHVRRLKSRSAQERPLQLDANLPSSPRSLNICVPQSSAGPSSARTPRDMMRTGMIDRPQSDWLLPWEHCDSLHSVLSHAQKVTLSRANLKRE